MTKNHEKGRTLIIYATYKILKDIKLLLIEITLSAYFYSGTDFKFTIYSPIHILYI